MDKKYSPIIVLIVFAIVLNFVALGMLDSQTSNKNTIAINRFDKPISNVIARVTDVSNSSTGNDSLAITSVQRNLTEGSFLVTISNNDPLQVAITSVSVNGCPANLENDLVIPANSAMRLLLTITDGLVFAHTYQISLVSSEGQSATYYEIVD